MTMKEARENKGMTQQELAKAVGVKAVSICRYELGERTPRLAVAKKLGVILDIPWWDLIDNKKAG